MPSDDTPFSLAAHRRARKIRGPFLKFFAPIGIWSAMAKILGTSHTLSIKQCTMKLEADQSEVRKTGESQTIK